MRHRICVRFVGVRVSMKLVCTAEEASDLPFGRTLPPSARGENCRITWNSCSLLPWLLPLDSEITLSLQYTFVQCKKTWLLDFISTVNIILNLACSDQLLHSLPVLGEKS